MQGLELEKPEVVRLSCNWTWTILKHLDWTCLVNADLFSSRFYHFVYLLAPIEQWVPYSWFLQWSPAVATMSSTSTGFASSGVGTMVIDGGHSSLSSMMTWSLVFSAKEVAGFRIRAIFGMASIQRHGTDSTVEGKQIDVGCAKNVIGSDTQQWRCDEKNYLLRSPVVFLYWRSVMTSRSVQVDEDCIVYS